MMMNLDPTTVIIDDEPLGERENRPRSRTWPILPPPIETIHEHERDAEIAEPPPIIEEVEPEEEEEENEAQKTETNPRKNSRKNAWGNLSYADLITQAIQSSPEQRLTLSQIYEWMVRNIPYFKDKGDSTSSAGWKNSIRHNLSLHSRFMRVQNDNNGKSSYWVINPDAKPGKSSRRRSGSVDGQPKSNKKRSKKYQSTDDISALSPNAMKMIKNRSYDNLFAPSPCSSTDSLSNLEEFHSNDLSYPYAGDSFARPRSTSNVSTQSSINGRTTPPPHMELDDMLTGYEDKQIGSSGVADEIQSMSIETNNYNTSVPNTINLNDSMKLPTRRPHSDSFGSGDSGYESPAFPSPIQPGQIPLQNRPTLNKLPSPNLVPNKPPPPYTTNYHNQIRGQMFNNTSYYTQQQQQQQQQRINMMNNQAPRLKHLPITTQQGSFQTNQTLSNFQTQRLTNNRTFPTTTTGLSQQNTLPNNTLQNNIFDSYLPKSNTIIPNITVDNKMFLQQPRTAQQTVKGLVYNNDDIPMDLHQVKLFGFDDQQQLASDLDAIINNEMEASNLKSICEPYKNDTNNNTNTNNSTAPNMFNTQPVSAFPGQHWVR